MVGVDLVVEGVDLLVAEGPVEGDGLRQGPVGLEAEELDAPGPGHRLQLDQQPSPEAQPPGRRVDPHALDVGHRAGEEVQRATADGALGDAGQEQHPLGLDHVVHGEGLGGVQVVPGLEALVDLGEVGPQAGVGLRAVRVLGGDGHLTEAEQAVDGGHGVDQRPTVVGAERVEHRPGQLVAQALHDQELGPAGVGVVDRAHPAVGRVGRHRHQPLLLQRPQQPAEVARVQPEPVPQRADVEALGADLPEDPGRRQRTAPGQVLVVQHADALGDGAVEASDLPHGRLVHSSDLSQRSAVRDRPLACAHGTARRRP